MKLYEWDILLFNFPILIIVDEDMELILLSVIIKPQATIALKHSRRSFFYTVSLLCITLLAEHFPIPRVSWIWWTCFSFETMIEVFYQIVEV